MHSIFVVVFAVFQALSAHAAFHFTDCTPSSSPMHVTKVAISPDPLNVPGDMHLSFDGYTNGTISHSKLHLKMVKKHGLFGADLTIPCLSHVGSCDYPDICTIVHDMETQNWGFGALTEIAKSIKAMFAAQNIDVTQCPFNGRQIHVQDYTMHLPHIPSAFSGFAAGDYHIEMKMTDNASNAVILCIKADVHINAPGHHFLLGGK